MNADSIPAPGPLWRLNVYKYDGRLHITLPLYLMDDDGTRLWMRTPVGGEINHLTRGKSWAITRPSDMFFWREQWYNVYVNYDESWQFRNYYCNVGLPPEIRDGEIAYVDLDLDVQIWADGRMMILDEDEFEEHRVLFGYPEAVQQSAQDTVEDILARWRAGAEPFSWYNTRP
jgi:protein associated with RNAse G/E